jgi:oligosaccharide repeat unit polymerase
MIEEFFFLLFFTLFLLIWSILLKYSGVKILTISIPSFLIISIFIFQYLGFPILFFFLDDYRAYYVQDRAIIWKMFLWTSFSITLIIIGFIAARRSFGPLHLANQHNAFSNSITPIRPLQRVMLLILFIISVLVLFVYLSKVGFHNVALLSAFGITDSKISIEAQRSYMGNAFEGNYHWYQLFMRDFLSIVSVAFFGQWLLRKKFFSFILFIISFLICTFSMLMAIEKGPIAFYLISLLLIYVILKTHGRLQFKQLVKFVFFGIFLTSPIYIYFMSGLSLLEGAKNTISRVFSGQMHALYHYLEIFPEQINFLWGRSFPNPKNLLPFEPFDLTKELSRIVFPEDKLAGVVGSMPTFYWGEMYANFSYLGIIIPPFFIGYFLYWLNSIIFKLQMTPLVLSLFIWIILHYGRLSVTSLSSFLIDITMVIMIFVLMLFIGIPNKFKIRYFKFRNN